jgi:hypothetical protein
MLDVSPDNNMLVRVLSTVWRDQAALHLALWSGGYSVANAALVLRLGGILASFRSFLRKPRLVGSPRCRIDTRIWLPVCIVIGQLDDISRPRPKSAY